MFKFYGSLNIFCNWFSFFVINIVNFLFIEKNYNPKSVSISTPKISMIVSNLKNTLCHNCEKNDGKLISVENNI